MTQEKANKKRILGTIFPFIILGYMAVIYYGLVVRLYFRKPCKYKANLGNWFDSLLVLIFHVLLVFIFWSYFSTMLTDPGMPPNFWVM